MATYTITINERTTVGKNLVAYLKHLKLIKESSLDKSIREVKEGKVHTYSNYKDLIKSLNA